MSEVSDADELAALATTLKRHLERRRRAGIRFSPKADPPQAKAVNIKNDSLLAARRPICLPALQRARKPILSKNYAPPSAIASAVNYVRQEPISYSVSVIRAPS